MSGQCWGSDNAEKSVEKSVNSLEISQISAPCPNENVGTIHNFIFYIPPRMPETVTRWTTPSLGVIDIGKMSETAITQNPDIHGIIPRAKIPDFSLSKTTTRPEIITRPARHALGETHSIFTSASELPQGAGGIKGSHKFYIDIAVLERHGAKIITVSELIDDLKVLKAEQPSTANRIDRLINTIEKIEREVLIEGKAPPSAVMTEHQYANMKKLNTLGKGLFVLGIALTVYDLGDATYQSVQKNSIRPISAEVIRQAGGWGAAWAGAKIGALGGAAVGIGTGPWAIASSAAGAIVFGFAGYFGADWVADYIHEN